MFSLQENVQIISVDKNYVKTLYDVDAEVQYNEQTYDSKKYIGLLLTNEGTKYVVPMSSAKEKYKALNEAVTCAISVFR